MLLSARSFQTTALSDRGARGEFCAAPLDGLMRSAATASSLAVFLSPGGSIPYCLYNARISFCDICGLLRSAVLGNYRSFGTVAKGIVTYSGIPCNMYISVMEEYTIVTL